MKYIVLIIGSCFIFSCASIPKKFQKTVELTFESVSFTFFYGATEAQFKDLIKETDSILRHHPKHSSYTLYTYIKKLEEKKLLRKPYILAYDENDTKIIIYLNQKEYEKVRKFSYKDLYNEGKKVILKLNLIQKDTHLFYSDQIIDITKVKGNSKINGKTTQFLHKKTPKL